MQTRRLLITGLTLCCSIVPLLASSAPAPAAPTTHAGSGISHEHGAALITRRELIYVANADGGPVTVYLADSRGAVTPVRTVMAPNDPNAYWDPWGVTFDRSGHLFVQTFLSDATTFVFAPGAHGITAPLRKFMGIGPDNRGIAVDSKGFEYVAGSEQPTVLVVEAPGARGKAGNLYQVPPVRTIQLNDIWDPWPSDLAVDAKNEILAVTSPFGGNAVEIFRGGAHGGSTPVRVISGPRTGLGSCGSVCHLVIAVAPRTGLIYVGVTDGARTHITVFAANARGNARPVMTIKGRATDLSGKAITGIAISRCDGTVYVMVHDSGRDFTPARIIAYSRYARGNAHPVRAFTDRHSRLVPAMGLAITGCTSR